MMDGNSIDLFYKVKMPEIFFLSHAIGAVLGNVKYESKIVVFQNVTVGRVGESIPHIQSGSILYPGAMVIGRSVIGRNCVIGAGVKINNMEIPDDSIVISHEGKQIVEKRKKNYLSLYLN